MRSSLLAIIMALPVSVFSLQACSTSTEPVPFSMEVVPEQLKGNAIAGQQVVFLIVINDEGKSSQAVTISAEATGSSVNISPETIVEGQVAEITVIPGQSSAGNTVTVNFKGKRDKLEAIKTVTFEVVPGEDDRGPVAAEMRDRFVPWLASNRPELGISPTTAWQGTMVSPQWLVVSHYLFFSEEWEMHVEWHNMIPPYDWVRIDLRHRMTETKPSYAFEVSSVSANSEPHQIETPSVVWR